MMGIMANLDLEKKRAYYDVYFNLSNGVEPFKFFIDERITFWADDLIDFFLETGLRYSIHLDMKAYAEAGMDYLIQISESYKESIRQMKRVETYGK